MEEKISEQSDKEQIREQKRIINRSKRTFEREKRKLILSKKKMLLEIKKMAKKGQILGAKMLAKDIVRITSKINKIEQFIGQLSAISMRISYCSSLKKIEDSMNNTIKALITVNNILNSQKVEDLEKQVIKENMKLDLKSEMIKDLLNGIGESMENEEEEELLLNQVYQKIGVKIGDEMVDVENKKINNIPQKHIVEEVAD